MFSDFRTEAMFSQRFKRIASALVLFFFSFTFYSPAAYAAFSELERQNNPPKNSLAYVNPVGETLDQLAQQIDLLRKAVTKDGNKAVEHSLREIESLADAFAERDAQMRDELHAERQALSDSGLPAESMARHEAFETNYLKHSEGVQSGLKELSQWQQAGADRSALPAILAKLDSHLQHPVRNPWQSFANDLDFVTPPPRNLYTQQSAIEGVLGVSGEPTWDLSDYLATDSATASSDAIRETVSELGPDPLALFQRVHDTIRFIPSYGVMQGAAYTMETEQGNAFDTASTLIALYREAGIPARYSYGTVALPAEAVQNWVGGVTNVDAATNILSQGGIPQRQLSYGGATEEVELEHVWVEAWIGGEWVGLDPSFKQYTYTEGLDIESQVPLNADQFLSQLQSSATVNEAEGWVQGVDVVQVQSQLEDYQSRVESFINNQHSNATLGEVLGTQQIVPEQSVAIEDVQLPYKDIRASAVAPNVPESLYYTFRLQIGNTTGGSFGAPVQWAGTSAELERKTTELVGKSIAISFRPASEADQQTLESYLPENLETVEDLPEQLPANTVNMIGEITVDGEVVASTPSVTLGQSLMTRLGFDAPERSWRYSENNLIAGQYQAVGIDMQGVSPDQLTALKTRIEETSAKLNAEDFAGLTKHDLVGSILQAGIQGYLAETYAMDQIAARASDIVYNRSPSYGTFSTQMNVSYLFGMPRNVLFSGVVMDVDQISSNTESVDNCYEDWVAFNRSSGMRSSAYEHLIPERLFSTENNPAEGVSTAKALALAMAEGQRIYTLTQDNATNLSQITIDSDARSEIQMALQRGFEVTVHQQPINVNGWEGSGYAIIDPERGVGAYKISGGASGGFVVAFAATVLGILAGLALVSGGYLVLGIAVLAWELINFGLWIEAIENASNLDEFNEANFGQTMVSILGLMLAPGIGAQAASALIFGVVISAMLTTFL
ncbi:MAG: transglutaminase family protein [Oleiphilaceae bacterium]|nr:transglutaminase family protein [Oleiphilaceae bacterium]